MLSPTPSSSSTASLPSSWAGKDSSTNVSHLKSSTGISIVTKNSQDHHNPNDKKSDLSELFSRPLQKLPSDLFSSNLSSKDKSSDFSSLLFQVISLHQQITSLQTTTDSTLSLSDISKAHRNNKYNLNKSTKNNLSPFPSISQSKHNQNNDDINKNTNNDNVNNSGSTSSSAARVGLSDSLAVCKNVLDSFILTHLHPSINSSSTLYSSYIQSIYENRILTIEKHIRSLAKIRASLLQSYEKYNLQVDIKNNGDSLAEIYSPTEIQRKIKQNQNDMANLNAEECRLNLELAQLKDRTSLSVEELPVTKISISNSQFFHHCDTEQMTSSAFQSSNISSNTPTTPTANHFNQLQVVQHSQSITPTDDSFNKSDSDISTVSLHQSTPPSTFSPLFRSSLSSLSTLSLPSQRRHQFSSRDLTRSDLHFASPIPFSHSNHFGSTNQYNLDLNNNEECIDIKQQLKYQVSSFDHSDLAASLQSLPVKIKSVNQQHYSGTEEIEPIIPIDKYNLDNKQEELDEGGETVVDEISCSVSPFSSRFQTPAKPISSLLNKILGSSKQSHSNPLSATLPLAVSTDTDIFSPSSYHTPIASSIQPKFPSNQKKTHGQLRKKKCEQKIILSNENNQNSLEGATTFNLNNSEQTDGVEHKQEEDEDIDLHD